MIYMIPLIDIGHPSSHAMSIVTKHHLPCEAACFFKAYDTCIYYYTMLANTTMRFLYQ